MTNLEILDKMIVKAKENGYHDKHSISLILNSYDSCYVTNLLFDNGAWYEKNIQINLCEIIFSHGFAKAFWGEDEVEIYPSMIRGKLNAREPRYADVQMSWTLPVWEYHLQQMVLSDEPLKYLEKFL